MTSILDSIDKLADRYQFDDALDLIDSSMGKIVRPLDRKDKRLLDILDQKKKELIICKRKWLEKQDIAEVKNLTYQDEEQGEQASEVNNNLLMAIHKADKAIEEAITLRMKVMTQSEKLMEFSDKFDRMSEQLPAVGRLIKKINTLDLRNQLILHMVFYVCIYCFITSAVYQCYFIHFTESVFKKSR